MRLFNRKSKQPEHQHEWKTLRVRHYYTKWMSMGMLEYVTAATQKCSTCGQTRQADYEGILLPEEIDT